MKLLRDGDQCRVDLDIWTPVTCRRGRMAGGEYIASHTITYEYIITDDPHHGLLLLISPWSGENSHGLYFSLL
jgi:hypothetical protein